jgi:hypothetical protein
MEKERASLRHRLPHGLHSTFDRLQSRFQVGPVCLPSGRMVGATWVVSTELVTVLPLNLGLDTSIITLVSSCANPPCSACFLELPV